MWRGQGDRSGGLRVAASSRRANGRCERRLERTLPPALGGPRRALPPHRRKATPPPAGGRSHPRRPNVELPGDEGQRVNVYSASPDTPSAEALALLASWTVPLAPGDPPHRRPQRERQHRRVNETGCVLDPRSSRYDGRQRLRGASRGVVPRRGRHVGNAGTRPLTCTNTSRDGGPTGRPSQREQTDLQKQPSGRQDLNLRPLDPQSSALPSCATSRPLPQEPCQRSARVSPACAAGPTPGRLVAGPGPMGLSGRRGTTPPCPSRAR